MNNEVGNINNTDFQLSNVESEVLPGKLISGPSGASNSFNIFLTQLTD